MHQFSGLIRKPIHIPTRQSCTSTHWASDAHVAKDAGERFYRMAKGSKRAGDLLAKHTDANVADRDNLVYSAVFCYRQYIELALKEVIEDYGDKIGVPPDRNNHKLCPLWGNVMLILKYYYGHDASECPDIAVVGDHIAEFANIDEHSNTFRYPMQRTGQSFEIKNDQLNLAQLRDVMESIYTFFDCLASDLHSMELREDYRELG
jgi:hypothetical protein